MFKWFAPKSSNDDLGIELQQNMLIKDIKVALKQAARLKKTIRKTPPGPKQAYLKTQLNKLYQDAQSYRQTLLILRGELNSNKSNIDEAINRANRLLDSLDRTENDGRNEI